MRCGAPKWRFGLQPATERKQHDHQPSQKALIHLVKTKLGWDDDTYRQVLVRIAGVTSSTELD